MKKVLIGGIGNVLLGDDGVGPYIAQLLTSCYEFENSVEILDLGTPALDLVDQISGRDAVIFIDSVDHDAAPGTVLLYSREDIVRQGATPRMYTHSAALVDTLLGAEFLGVSPTSILLVGIQGQSYEPGCTLSSSVAASLYRGMTAVLRQLDRLGVEFRCRETVTNLGVWWASAAQPCIDRT